MENIIKQLRGDYQKFLKDIEGRPYAGDPVLDWWLSKLDLAHQQGVKDSMAVVGEYDEESVDDSVEEQWAKYNAKRDLKVSLQALIKEK